MTDPVKLYPKNAAKNADNVLEMAVGKYEDVLILGLTPEGMLDARATLGMGPADILWLVEQFKTALLAGNHPTENFDA